MKRQKAWPILVAGLVGVTTSAFGAEASEDSLPLMSGEIQKALVGKMISYDPPNWEDARIHEEFHPDGRWRGMLYGRGPIPSSGKWSIDGDQMCVTPDSGTYAERRLLGRYCRTLWQNRNTGELRINYLFDGSPSPEKMGLQTIVVDASLLSSDRRP